jgi:hypothetical protein
MQTLPELVAAFCDCTLPKSEWTHEAHLRVGLWHVLEMGEAAAMEILRTRIRAYNESVGGRNTDQEGYHETITQFYVKLIASFLRETKRARPIEELAEELIHYYGDRDLPMRYYSKTRLYSTEARLRYIEPDWPLGAPTRSEEHAAEER